MSKSTTILRLPFVPPSYPDEILGSWLSRVSVSMGGGAWRTLLEAVGFDRRLQVPYFNMVDYDHRLNKLFCVLGTSYENVLLKLTTLPYWLTFAASPSLNPLPGTSKIPVPFGSQRNIPLLSIRSLGVQRNLGQRADARYCPECLLWDCQNVGQPYWHRAHQLPNIYFCHKHLCELRTTCPYCGLTCLRSGKSMVTMPAMVCQCGKRLDVSGRSQVLSFAESKLINVSVRALNHELPEWDYRHVHAHFKTLLFGDDGFLRRYKAVLSNTFALTESTDVILSSSKLGRAAACLSFRAHLSMASAPECCGLLVALNVDFDSATKEFRKYALEGKIFIPRPGTGPHINTMTVEASRLVLLNLKEKYPSRRASYHQRYYWFSRLKDSEWFCEHFPKAFKRLVPTLASDRSNILARYADRRTKLGRSSNANESAAEIRAQIRDFAWFEEQRVSIRVEISKNVDIAKKTISNSRVAALEKALSQVLKKEERPSRIFTATLASIVGLSHSQAWNAIRANAALRRQIAEANNDKKRRQLLWAAQQLHVDGARLNKNQLGKRAGLPRADISDELLKEIYGLYFNEQS